MDKLHSGNRTTELHFGASENRGASTGGGWHLAYVIMTRHREQATLYVLPRSPDEGRLPDLAQAA